MSSTPDRPYPPVLIRAGQAERLDLIGHVLLADSSATAGGADQPPRRARPRRHGAGAYWHDHSSELFYILDGAFDLLVYDNIVTARSGDLLVVPPGAPHAFAAHHAPTAQALIISLPLPASNDSTTSATSSGAGRGSEQPGLLFGLQDRFCTHSPDSPAWQCARAAA